MTALALKTARREILPHREGRVGRSRHASARRVGEKSLPVRNRASNPPDDAWGNAVESTGTDDNPYGYTGERTDADTGLIYLRARWYDPATGRFVSADPTLGRELVPLSKNAYLYAEADPANNRDPTGLGTLGDIAVAINISASIYSIGVGIWNVTQGNYAAGAVDIGLGFLGVGTIARSSILFLGRYGPELRGLYVNLVGTKLPEYIEGLRRLGYSSERIARLAVAERNAIKVFIRQATSDKGAIGKLLTNLAELRNLLKYGNRVGPTIEQLLKKYGSWEDILEAAERSNEEINKLSGLGVM